MAAIFRPGANYWAALTLLGLAAVCAAVSAGGGSGPELITHVTSTGLSVNLCHSATNIMSRV